MQFLAAKHIVIDSHERTTIDKHSGHNLLNPPPITPRARSAQWVTPPPTLKKVRIPKLPTLEQTGAPALASYLLPGPIITTVRDRIEGLAFQEVLKVKDAQMKVKFADRFPTRLPTAPTMSPATCSTASN
jgi:hypothetical protein